MIIQTKDELNKIKTAAKINTEALFYLKDLVEPGITSLEVDKKAGEFYEKNKVKPAFLDYSGYPAIINFQTNDQVVHNIPNKYQVVQEGDIVSIDTGCIYEGYYADQATSFGVGKIREIDEKLLYIGKESVNAGSRACIVGNGLGDVGYAQQTIIEMAGFSVVREFCGHEIGRNLWENTRIPGYGSRGQGPALKENMLVCIENQVCEKDNKIFTDKKNKWTVYTQDGSNCVTFEHMVIIRKKKAEIITKI